MIKKTIDFLSNLTLTFWLLNGITFFFITGMQYSRAHYRFIESLDNMTVQNWFVRFGLQHPEWSWWIAVIFILMILLGINTILCALNRVRNLLRTKNSISTPKLLFLLTPSFIHILFILLLAGHLLTFTAGLHQRVPIVPDAVVTLPSLSQLRVMSIDMQNYPEHTILKDRVYKGSITLQEKNGQERILRFMNPLYIDGYYLHLDVEQLKKSGDSASKTTVCNRAEVARGAQSDIQVSLLITRDPGLSIIMAGFIAMILLLFFYYVAQRRLIQVE